MIARLTARSSATLAGAAIQTRTLRAIAAIQRAGMPRMISPGGRLSNPVQVRLAPADDRQHDELWYLVVVQLAHTRPQRRHTRSRGLDDELPLTIRFDLSLPT